MLWLYSDSYWLPLDCYELLVSQSMSRWPCPHFYWLNQDPSFLRMNCFLFTSHFNKLFFRCQKGTFFHRCWTSRHLDTVKTSGAPAFVVILTPRQSNTGIGDYRRIPHQNKWNLFCHIHGSDEFHIFDSSQYCLVPSQTFALVISKIAWWNQLFDGTIEQ